MSCLLRNRMPLLGILGLFSATMLVGFGAQADGDVTVESESIAPALVGIESLYDVRREAADVVDAATRTLWAAEQEAGIYPGDAWKAQAVSDLRSVSQWASVFRNTVYSSYINLNQADHELRTLRAWHDQAARSVWNGNFSYSVTVELDRLTRNLNDLEYEFRRWANSPPYPYPPQPYPPYPPHPYPPHPPHPHPAPVPPPHPHPAPVPPPHPHPAPVPPPHPHPAPVPPPHPHPAPVPPPHPHPAPVPPPHPHPGPGHPPGPPHPGHPH